MHLKDKIKHLRKQNNLTQDDLAKRLGVAKTTVSTWERGGNRPLMDKIVVMSDMFNVPISYFFDEPTEDIEIVNIPLLGAISCGDPITAIENVDEYQKEIKNQLPTGNLFYLKAQGNSMYPTIPDGAMVMVREQVDVENGEIAAVLINGDEEATIKRVRRINDHILLEPENKEYNSLIIDKRNPARIIGKVVRVKYDL
ncbi:helix-turn-helix domain-containing protein [Carnobacterium sp. PL17GRE32]|uniref:LexA family protein n=1 Tax=Carnobacterium sp. PL17GRE32 TaxID=2592355 RepID=UPI0011EC8092|nr:XRE family transcriptional regulator [Carnobacterium sp. PL17GRE32]KAF3306002.1 helix-turn-helix domain-containing protein [Carnobacterium sp. PL17GRE32]